MVFLLFILGMAVEDFVFLFTDLMPVVVFNNSSCFSKMLSKGPSLNASLCFLFLDRLAFSGSVLELKSDKKHTGEF